MKYLFLLFFFPLVSSAQLLADKQSIVDSLSASLDLEIPDSMKILNTNKIGREYRRIRDYKSASIWHHKGLEIARSIPDSNEIALSYYAIGGDAYLQRDYEVAVPILLNSLSLSRRIKDQKGIAFSANMLGLIRQKTGQMTEALEYYKESYQVRLDMGDEKSAATPLYNIGAIYEDRGDSYHASVYFQKALAIRKKYNDVGGMARTLNYIGLIEKNNGNYPKSVEIFKESLALYLQNGDSTKAKFPLNNMGLAYKSMDSYKEAKECYQKCIAINQNLGDIESLQGNYNNLGLLYQNIDLDSALNYFQTALDLTDTINDDDLMAAAKSNIATTLYAKKKYDQALISAKEALNYARATNVNNRIIESIATAYYTYVGCDSLAPSKSLLQELIYLRDQNIRYNFPVMSEKEKEVFFSTIADEYELLFDHALKYDSTMSDAVYDKVLMTKGMLLKSTTAMRNAVLKSENENLIKTYKEWIQVRQKLADNYAEGQEDKVLEEQATALEKILVKSFSEFADVQKLQDISWRDVQFRLQDDEAAIEIIRFTSMDNFWDEDSWEEVYCALIVRPDFERPEMIELFKTKEILEVLGSKTAREINSVSQLYGTQKEYKSELYQLIWQPMEKSLEGVRKVNLSPDGILHKISFAALAPEKEVLLCDRHEINLKSSTSKLVFPNDQNVAKKSEVTIFGDIVYTADSSANEIWKYLEGTKTEAEEIRNIMEGNMRKVNYYNLSKATEAQFKVSASKSELIHIATHGFFYPEPAEVKSVYIDVNESEQDLVFRGGRMGFGAMKFMKNKNPLMRSGLVFAGANNVWNIVDEDDRDKSYEDGVLTAEEVATMDMQNTQLVVLSACETGLGEIKGNGHEGVYGLQRSFKSAGVKFLIMSLWQVPDKETAEFMTKFYNYLTITENIPQAFDLAQQEMRKKYDPYYWAAFVLVE